MPAQYIDFHTHAFPDALAERAMEHLTHKGNVAAFHKGTISRVARIDG